MNHEKKTKQEAIREVIADLKNLRYRIEENDASPGDYQKYQEIMALMGMDDSYTMKTLRDSGFTTWKEFYDERNKPSSYTNGRIAPVIGSITGTIDGVTGFLENNINSIE